MALMFGRFEIQGEISKSDTATIYKALDTETSQVVALKTQDLGPLGEGAGRFRGHADRRRGTRTSSHRSEHCSPAWSGRN